MIERTTEQRFIEDHRAGLWYTIEIEPRRIALFHAWAAHLGLSDADLAARIFEEGTVALVLEEMDWPSTFDPRITAAQAVDGLLDDLARHLAVPTARKEGPDAPDNG